jgi:hypothetical protein
MTGKLWMMMWIGRVKLECQPHLFLSTFSLPYIYLNRVNSAVELAT